MKARIKNVFGQWYKGNENWGNTKEDAEIYYSIYDVPDKIFTYDGEVCLTNDWNEVSDIRYYRESEKDPEEIYAYINIEKTERGSIYIMGVKGEL